MSSAFEELKRKEAELLALNSKLDDEKKLLYKQFEVRKLFI